MIFRFRRNRPRIYGGTDGGLRDVGVVETALAVRNSDPQISAPDQESLRKALLANPEQFVQTFTEGLLTYAMGRTEDYYDMPTVRRIVRDAATKDYKFSSIVLAVVKSDQFRVRRVPQPVQSVSK